MYPDVSYLLHGLIGTEPDGWIGIAKTFGLFLLLAFLTAAWLLRYDLLRREKIGQLKGRTVKSKPGHTVTVWDYVFNGIFGFLLGYKIPYAISHIDQWKADPGSVLLTTEGWWWSGLIVGVLFALYYFNLAGSQKTEKEQLYTVYPSDRVGPITMAAAVGGLLGAKLFAIIEYLPRFFEDPIGVLLSGDGLAIYGGLIGGAAAVAYYAYRNGIKILPLADAAAPGLIVAYGLGRLGCQLSGDGDWGIVAAEQPSWWIFPDWAWSFTFPHNVMNRGVLIPGCEWEYCHQLPAGVYPTSIYEFLMAVAIGAILWSLRKRLTDIPGMLISIYLILNGIERFFIEFIRVNDRYDVLGFQLSQAQLIAIGFMVAGGLGMFYFNKRALSRVRGGGSSPSL